MLSHDRPVARLNGVDALRGLAILFVLLNHTNMQLLFAHVPYTRGLPSQLVSSLVWNGQQGVQIFFAVSGFLITSTSLRRWRTPDRLGIRAFYQLRFARIAPLLLLLLVILSLLHLAGVRHFVVSQQTGSLKRALAAALTFHVNLLEARRGYLPGNWDILWSLSVEETFYLFFPLFARLLRRQARLVGLLLAFIVAGPLARSHAFNHNPVWREYSYLGGMDAIALGCLTAILVHQRQPSKSSVRWLAIIGTAGMLFTLALSNQAEAWGLDANGLSMTILAISTCLLIAAAAASSGRASALLAPVTRLGRRSYEVYLTHMFIVFLCADVFTRMGKQLRMVPWLFLAVILLSAMLGEVVARVYADPMNASLRSRFSPKRIAVHAPAAPESVG